jgi:hypothetical protein
MEDLERLRKWFRHKCRLVVLGTLVGSGRKECRRDLLVAIGSFWVVGRLSQLSRSGWSGCTDMHRL